MHRRASTRVTVSFTSAVAASVAAAFLIPWQAALLVGWNAGAIVMIAWVLRVAWFRDSAGTAAIATMEDDSRAVADFLLVSAAVVSLVAVGVALVKAANSQGAAKAATTGLAVVTVLLSWTLVHVVYMLRYARLYYADGGGIGFPDTGDEPDYRDFAYVAFTIGMTYQVSDTNLTTKVLRRNATHHALLSYVFGAVVIATAINGVASLLK